MNKKLFFLGLFAVYFSGCISGPKNHEQKFSEKLNADSYESSNNIMGVPVLTRKPTLRKISGKVQCGEGLSQRPANQVIINLVDDNKVVATTSTDSSGNYNITTNISIEKSYQLQASAKCGVSRREISLKEDSTYDLILRTTATQ